MADGTQVAEPVAAVSLPARVTAFFVAVRQELEKVSWPPRDELVKATRAIVLLSITLGILIGLLDFVLQKILVDGVAALAR